MLSAVYEKLLLAQTGGELQKSINGYNATFSIDSSNEFLSLDSYRGEREVLQSFLNDIGPADVVFDIGANVGFFSIFAATNYPSAIVVAFEPHSDNIDRIHRSANLEDVDVITYETLLSDHTSFASFPVGSSVPGVSDLSMGSSTDHFVPTYRGEELIASHDLPSPTILKVDVEGAELDVLTGFGPVLEQVKVVYCEVHKERIRQFGSDPMQVESHLQERSFRTSRLQEDEDVFHLRAEKLD